MNLIQPRWRHFLFVFAAVLACAWCIVRDTNLTEQYPGDLRNRVVGARLQSDGVSPYFYHWKTGNDERFYDWNNNSPVSKISNVTATPFFHQMMVPLSKFPQKTIAWLWLVFAYLAHAIIIVCSYKIAGSTLQKRLTITAGILFLFTSAWTESVYNGQMYFVIALFAMLLFVSLYNNRYLVPAFFAGVFGVSLILIKITLLLYLAPFVLFAVNCSKRYLLTLTAGAVVTIIFAFSGKQTQYWRDYSAAVKDHIRSHQGILPELRERDSLPLLSSIDGWQRADISTAVRKGWYKNQPAATNVFVLINKITGTRISITFLSSLLIASLVILTFVYLKKFPLKNQPELFTLALFGFLLHMTTDYFSPVHRFHYYAAQWSFPLLLVAAFYHRSFPLILTIGVLIGMFFNGLPVSIFPMQHTIGEYILYGSFFGILFSYKQQGPV